ncbi:MAG: DUF2244 domain-containing protein [Rhodospirillales bacterium]
MPTPDDRGTFSASPTGAATEVAPVLHFEAVVVPHRSLSPRGLAIVLGCLGLASLTITTMFWMLGAWPIAGFNGGEMLVAAALLRSHVRSRRAREVLLLTDENLRILRFDEDGGRQERQLPAAWLAVIVEERPGCVPALFPGQPRPPRGSGAYAGRGGKSVTWLAH